MGSAFSCRSANSQKSTAQTRAIAESQIKKIQNRYNRPIDMNKVFKVISLMTGSGGSIIDVSSAYKSGRDLASSIMLSGIGNQSIDKFFIFF